MPIRFRLQVCERCGREMVHACRGEPFGLRPQDKGAEADPSAPLPSTSLRASGASDYRICSGCEPAAFERAAFEAGRQELLQ